MPVVVVDVFGEDGMGVVFASWGNSDTADITVTNVSGLTTLLETAAGEVPSRFRTVGYIS
ncbi:hypothetical protein AB0B45_47785 [Nonomuraea sp. NPDC049152]|uniref:hypothetical protein n=1 Tax=Nonomuraea sp. NPDC049152 TaxID=3154350 RepID=UPI0033E626EC